MGDSMSTLSLADKNILVIMPTAFGYDQEIKRTLESQGAHVNIIFENIKELSLAYKFVYVYLKPWRSRFIYHYYKKKISAINRKIDYLFVIRGSTLTKDILSLIQEKAAPDCKYIMYQWDSIKNNSSVMPIIGSFDSIATFDIQDAQNLNWKYRPLFFIEHFISEKKSREIDIAYICSVHSQRFQIYKKVKSLCLSQGWSFHHHMFINWVLFLKYKFLDRNPVICEAKSADLSFRSLSLTETYSLYQKSKIALDYTHPGQTGFTMRTIETLGNECKLITNNTLIRDADFFDPNNILVYEGTDVEIPEWFVQTPYRKLDNDVYKKYSLTQWIQDIFEQ